MEAPLLWSWLFGLLSLPAPTGNRDSEPLGDLGVTGMFKEQAGQAGHFVGFF